MLMSVGRANAKYRARPISTRERALPCKTFLNSSGKLKKSGLFAINQTRCVVKSGGSSPVSLEYCEQASQIRNSDDSGLKSSVASGSRSACLKKFSAAL